MVDWLQVNLCSSLHASRHTFYPVPLILTLLGVVSWDENHTREEEESGAVHVRPTRRLAPEETPANEGQLDCLDKVTMNL